ncbi:hypothetical protein TWF696_002900 [Orbilia brochopaga]|uniref:F-box domain-containing protein n=1 Tax=Orbilia brochopaga TaxID=3140254 RepID=A0AAV9U0H7_9PEZI
MAGREVAALNTLPTELLLEIIARLRSKPTLRSLALTNRRLRAICMPYLFDSISVRSITALNSFVDSGVAENISAFIQRLVLRWDSVGAVVALEDQQIQEQDSILVAVTTAVGRMHGLKTVLADFPGAFTAFDKILEHNQHEALQTLTIRNGKWELAGPVDGLLQKLASLPALATLTLDGTISRASTATMIHRNLQPPVGAFASLNKLDLTSLSAFDDTLLSYIVASAGNLRTLSVKSCASITLANTRALLAAHGRKLHHLSLEILKQRTNANYNPTDMHADADGEGSRHELDDISDAEHLCPAIRACINLRTLDLFTNKICNEIFKPPTVTSSAISPGDTNLPTPPGSPVLLPTHAVEIPTPPSDANSLNPRDVTTDITLPPPICTYPSPPAYDKTREDDTPTPTTASFPPREKMTRVILRIPYDASCFGAGAGGPSVQQRYTRLCDGTPAGELLEIGKRAFEEGRVGLISVRGHWKGGPYLIMD